MKTSATTSFISKPIVGRRHELTKSLLHVIELLSPRKLELIADTSKYTANEQQHQTASEYVLRSIDPSKREDDSQNPQPLTVTATSRTLQTPTASTPDDSVNGEADGAASHAIWRNRNLKSHDVAAFIDAVDIVWVVDQGDTRKILESIQSKVAFRSGSAACSY